MNKIFIASIVLLLLAVSTYAMWTESVDVYVVDLRNQPVPGATVTITYQRTNPDSTSDGVETGVTDNTGKFSAVLRNFVPTQPADNIIVTDNKEKRQFFIRASTYFWSSEEARLVPGEDYIGTSRVFAFKAPVYMQDVTVYALDGEGVGIADVPINVVSPVAMNATTNGKGIAVFRIPNTYTLSVTGTYRSLTASNTSPNYDPTGMQSTNSLLSQYGITFSSSSIFGNVTNITTNISTGTGVTTLVDEGAGATSLSLSGKAVSLASENGTVKAAASTDSLGHGRVIGVDSSFFDDSTIEQGDNLKFAVNSLEYLLGNITAAKADSKYDICIDSLGLGNRYNGLVKISNEMISMGFSVIGTEEMPQANGSREITAAELANCNILITDRRGISNERPPYSNEAVTAIEAFVANNGSVLVGHEPGYTRNSEVSLLFDVYPDRALDFEVLSPNGNPISGVAVIVSNGTAMTAVTKDNGTASFSGISKPSVNVSFSANGKAYSSIIALKPGITNTFSYTLPAELNITSASAVWSGEGYCTLVDVNAIDSRSDAETTVEAQYSGKAVPFTKNGTIYSGKVCQEDTIVLKVVAKNQYESVSKNVDISIAMRDAKMAATPSNGANGTTSAPSSVAAKGQDMKAWVDANMSPVFIGAIIVVLALLFIVRDSIIYPLKTAMKFIRFKLKK